MLDGVSPHDAELDQSFFPLVLFDIWKINSLAPKLHNQALDYK